MISTECARFQFFRVPSNLPAWPTAEPSAGGERAWLATPPLPGDPLCGFRGLGASSAICALAGRGACCCLAPVEASADAAVGCALRRSSTRQPRRKRYCRSATACWVCRCDYRWRRRNRLPLRCLSAVPKPPTSWCRAACSCCDRTSCGERY